MHNLLYDIKVIKLIILCVTRIKDDITGYYPRIISSRNSEHALSESLCVHNTLYSTTVYYITYIYTHTHVISHQRAVIMYTVPVMIMRTTKSKIMHLIFSTNLRPDKQTIIFRRDLLVLLLFPFYKYDVRD